MRAGAASCGCNAAAAAAPGGIIRGRSHPVSGDLYVCGMYSWAGSQQQPGGFYRIRRTDKPVYVPLALNAQPKGISITFTAPLDPATAVRLVGAAGARVSVVAVEVFE